MFSMNRLQRERRAQILSMLVRGQQPASDKPHGGLLDQHRLEAPADVGDACAGYQGRTLRDLPARRSRRTRYGASATASSATSPRSTRASSATATSGRGSRSDADTKLAVSWLVGGARLQDCWTFIEDLRGRVAGRIQLTHGRPPDLLGVVGLVFRRMRLIGRSSSSSTRRSSRGRALQPTRVHRHRTKRPGSGSPIWRRSAPAMSSVRISR